MAFVQAAEPEGEGPQDDGTPKAGASLDYSKYGKKGAKARKAWLTDYPEKEYDPNTIVYCDFLWMRVHGADSPELILKDMKKTMTLEQADKEGWRLGESGQSGRGRSSLQGYRRKYPEKDIPDDAMGIAQTMKSGRLKWHLAGCHRFVVSPDNIPMTKAETLAKGGYVCEHCIERGPALTTADMAKVKARARAPAFTPPNGWTQKAFAANARPSQQELDLFVLESLATDYGIQESFYVDPMATLEEFMGRRFFFPVENWLTFYQAYRATGDKRILESLRVSARHYRDLCNEHLNVAQLKANDPEGMPFLYSMAVSARITLQLARKHPAQVSAKEIDEASGFLMAIMNVLKPIVEGDSNLDPEMGIPKPLADDFRNRAFNRAMNGIGTLAMATAALKDLQMLKPGVSYQSTVDRYSTCIREYFKNWKAVGYLEKEADGNTYFYYPYAAHDKGTIKDGVKLFGSDDVGHFSHSMQGVMLVHDATPELGADDDFMTAIANSVYHNSTTKNGSIQSPAADKVRPMSRHPYEAGPKNRLYMFEAFHEGLIDGQNRTLKGNKKASVNSDYKYRLKTLHAQYLAALRKDRSLIHLGEVK